MCGEPAERNQHLTAICSLSMPSIIMGMTYIMIIGIAIIIS